MERNKYGTMVLAILTSFLAFAGCSKVEDSLGDADYPSKGENGAAYYVDSRSGDDLNDGLSPETAWKSLERVGNVYLQAGNSILLRKGSEWTGQLAPKGSGTQSAPIRIGTYGDGDRPVINGGGTVDAGVKLENQSWWIVEGLEITNRAAERDMYRCGILVENNGSTTVSGITVRDNFIHDVTSSFGYSGVYHPHQFGGISFTTMNVDVPEEKFDNILIENNTVESVGRTGIVVWDFVWGSNTQSSTNVIIRGNTVRNTDSDGILTYGCNGSLIEYNVADGCGAYREDGGFNGAAAIWCTRGSDCIIQYNEARNTKALEGNDDGTGFDIDLDSSDCIVQYNYSHDNEGGCVMFCEGESIHNIFRYNISVNDGLDKSGVITPVRNQDAHIHDNLFIISEGVPFIRTGMSEGGMLVEDNFIINTGENARQEDWHHQTEKAVYCGNLYCNYENVPKDDGKAKIVDSAEAEKWIKGENGFDRFEEKTGIRPYIGACFAQPKKQN